MSDKPTDPIVYGGQTHHWLSRLRFRRRESLAVSKTTGGHVVGSIFLYTHIMADIMCCYFLISVLKSAVH